jgi:hypothetical protein
LKNPEPNLFIIGMKSYGRGSAFLLRLGHEQVQHVLTLLLPDESTKGHGAKGASAGSPEASDHPMGFVRSLLRAVVLMAPFAAAALEGV